MSWQVLILLNALAQAFSTISIRAVARLKEAEKASFAMGAAQSFFLFIGTILLVPFLGDVDFGMFSEYFWWFVGGGIASTLGNACAYKVLSYLEAGISTILNTIYVVFVVLLAAIVLDETLGQTQLIGAMLLLLAVVYGTLIARHPDIKKRHGSAWIYGLIFALVGGFIVAAAIVNEKYLIDRMNASTFLIITFGWQLFFTVLAAVIFQRRKLPLILDRTILKLNLASGLLRALAAAFIVLAIIKSDNISLITVVSNFKIVFVILIAAIILKEHQRMTKKLAAATVATLGLIIIFWE